MVFDDLHVVIGATGEEVLLEGFEDDLTWTTLTTSAIDSDELSLSSGQVHSGDRAAAFDFGKETNGGVRGFYRANGSPLLPVIVSTSFADSVGGTRVIVSLPGGLVPVEIKELVDYFPTLDPDGGGFLLFDLDTLVSYVDALNPVAKTSVNEVFLKTADGPRTDGDDEKVFNDLVRLVRGQGRVTGAAEQLDSLRTDPLVSAGWRAMVLVAVGVVLFTAGLGYVVYLSAIGDRSAEEIGLLRSLGLATSACRTGRAGAPSCGDNRPGRRCVGGLSDEPADRIVGRRGRSRWAGAPAVRSDHRVEHHGAPVRGAGGDVPGVAADDGASYAPPGPASSVQVCQYLAMTISDPPVFKEPRRLAVKP